MNEGEALKSNETGKIDILSFVNDVLNRLRSFWWVILILTVGLGAFNYFRSTTHYTPTYTAEATVAVSILHGGTYSNENTAQQMSKVFPYILTSGALSEIIADDLGVRTVPGRISAKNIEGTNLLTISVTGSDPDKVYKVLQSVLRKYPEVARYVIGQTEITVVDDSGVPEDTGKTTVIRGSLVKGLLIGFVIGVVLLLLYTLLTRTVRSEKDLTNLLNVNYLGGLPVVRQKKKDSLDGEINILVGANKDNYTESMRLIRTRLEKQMEKDDVLIVTSSIPGEGKSTVAANLAISFAEKGRNVIVVDCDLRNPTTKKIFGVTESYPGLSAYLRGECTVEETLVTIDVPGRDLRLQLLPGSDNISNTMEMMDSETMKALIEDLKNRADLIVLDTPPSAMLADAVMLTRYADGVAYVVLSDFAKRRVIYKGLRELQDSGITIYGCILNGSTASSGGYGKYGYYGRYGYYGSGKSGHYYTEEKKSEK